MHLMQLFIFIATLRCRSVSPTKQRLDRKIKPLTTLSSYTLALSFTTLLVLSSANAPDKPRPYIHSFVSFAPLHFAIATFRLKAHSTISKLYPRETPLREY